jgi:hypothetical protein
MKALKFCGTALASGLVIGAVVGGYIGGITGAGQAILLEMSAAAGYEQLTLLQYKEADTDHSRQALLGFTTFSKSMSKLQSAQSDKALWIDTGRNYLRLAALEQLAGNTSLSRQYVLNAQESFRSMGRDIPESDLDKQVAKIVTEAQSAVPIS